MRCFGRNSANPPQHCRARPAPLVRVRKLPAVREPRRADVDQSTRLGAQDAASQCQPAHSVRAMLTPPHAAKRKADVRKGCCYTHPDLSDQGGQTLESAIPLAAGRFRTDIEGLRGLCVLGVVLFHAFPGIISGGFVGVDAFFVLSGFLITRLLLEELSFMAKSISSTSGAAEFGAFCPRHPWSYRPRSQWPV